VEIEQAVTLPAYRCDHCGNRTRFDVYERLHRRRFAHFDLSGGMTVDDEEILESEIERVVCRWCQRDDAIVADAKTA
jgi:hypothetical protein